MSLLSDCLPKFLKSNVTIVILPAFFVTGCSLQTAGRTDGIDLNAIKSPIIFIGADNVAYRDPTAVYHNGTFYLYFTYIIHEKGRIYWCTGLSTSTDLVHWSPPERLTPKDRNLNFCAPGNIIRYKGKWVMCLQTYPTPNSEKYGNSDARVWITRSDDLRHWSSPEVLKVKGPNVPVEEIGRVIDPYLVEDKNEHGKWWCFFDTDAANISYSYDLKNWTYFNQIEAGENVCVLVRDDKYLMFHSPKNGIGIKYSNDMKHWYDAGRKITKHGTGSITLGQDNWPWAKGRLSAGFVLDLNSNPRIDKYIMFFHGSGPKPEPIHFDSYCSLGLAWSDDLKHWHWPGKTQSQHK